MTARQIAEVTARRAETVTGVVRLDAGPLHTKTTYGAGGRTDGVTVQGSDPTTVTVHLVVRFGERIPELADRVVDDVRPALQEAFPGAGPWEIGVDVVDVVTDVAPPSIEPPVQSHRALR